ncbi:hypothetical protein [Desulfosporosinus sp. SB140]|uniref:hypothetical protein n=1 Tax=Desulfosporosinus paludis TaxID=3115649 RepID=UPI00388E2D95
MTKTGVKAHWKDSLTGKLLVRFWISLLLVSLIMGRIQYQALNQFLMKGETQDLQAQIGLFDVNQIKLWLNHKQSFSMAWPDLGPGVVVGFYSSDKKFEGILSRQVVQSKNPFSLNNLIKTNFGQMPFQLLQKEFAIW